MTAYVALAESNWNAGGTYTYVLSPGSFEIKIGHIAYVYVANPSGGDKTPGTATHQITLSRYVNSSSSGSAGSIAATRQGAPATTATWGTSVSGTAQQLYHTTGWLSAGNFDPAQVSFSFDFPYDVTISPGSSFVFQDVTAVTASGDVNGGPYYLSVFFEELHLSWHY